MMQIPTIAYRFLADHEFLTYRTALVDTQSLLRSALNEPVQVWINVHSVRDGMPLYTPVGDSRPLPSPVTRSFLDNSYSSSTTTIDVDVTLGTNNDGRRPSVVVTVPRATDTEALRDIQRLFSLALRQSLTNERAAIRRHVINSAAKSKDLMSFLRRVIDNALTGYFGCDAASIFYLDTSIDALTLGATTGILEQNNYRLKRSDIRYFVDAKSFVSRSFRQNTPIVEEARKDVSLGRNTYGEDVAELRTRLFVPLRVLSATLAREERPDPVGVMRIINVHAGREPVTLFDIALLEYLSETVSILTRRYMRTLKIVHEQERAFHGYTTDLASIRLAVQTAIHLIDRIDLLGGSPQKNAAALDSALQRLNDAFTVQDNMSHQLESVKHSIDNAHISTRLDSEPCRFPFKSVFLRIIEAKRGMSLYYNRKEIRITSNGQDRFDEASQEMPPLYISIGAFYAIVRNIVENAIKYTNIDDIPTLDVGWSSLSGRVTFQFRDFGIGVEPGEVSMLWRQGFRSRRASRMQLRGNGLGLAFSRQLATEAGGSLDFRPPTDGRGGSVFILILPKDQRHA